MSRVNNIIKLHPSQRNLNFARVFDSLKTAQYNTTDTLGTVAKHHRDQYTEAFLDGLADKEAPINKLNNAEHYFAHRDDIIRREASLKFDWICQNKASEDERRANAIL